MLLAMLHRLSRGTLARHSIMSPSASPSPLSCTMPVQCWCSSSLWLLCLELLVALLVALTVAATLAAGTVLVIAEQHDNIPWNIGLHT